jgi:peptidylprolyl isomerase
VVKRLRTLSALATIPAVVLALAACSGSGSSDSSASATPSASATAISSCPTSGSAARSVKAKGDFDGKTAPTISFKKGLSASTPERSTLIKGSGSKIKTGDFVNVAYSVYRGSTAKSLTSVGYGSSESTAAQPLSVGGTGLAKALSCGVKIGDRIVLVGNGTQLGFTVKYQLVVVADVISKIPTHSTGAARPQSPSLPTVKDAANGEPTITIPKVAAPATTTAEVIKQGTGPTIKSGDTALVQYKGVVYATGTTFDSTWSRGEPTTFTIASGQLIAGFVTGLVGQKVGSQVLIVIPAKDAYGANPPEGSNIPKNAPLVFVVDILTTATGS